MSRATKHSSEKEGGTVDPIVVVAVLLVFTLGLVVIH
jgi:hypothetical protein